MLKKIVLLVLVGILFLKSPVLTLSEDTVDSLEQQRVELTRKLDELNKSKNTLANQIKILNSQYELTLLKINQTENSVKTLESEINSLTIEISKLDVQLNELSTLYVLQIIQNYKLQKKVPPFAFLISSSLNNFLEQYKYISNIQKNSQNSLINMETIRTNYDLQKTAKAEKQTELEKLQKTLASQKISLNNQKAAKNNLLEITKNDEKQYQQLLIAVQNKLSSFNNSSVGCLASSPGGGSDGNYYSQIDPRWCTNYIGLQTKYTIGNAGCYLTSMSMLLKKLNVNINPAEYAADPSRFTSTADLAAPTVPSGYSYKKIYGYDASTIANEFNNGRYIIAQVPMRGSPSGYHFIVLISGSNGDYKMHDPVYGADKNFTQYYTVSSIVSLRLITK